jgi:hypothetical protein
MYTALMSIWFNVFIFIIDIGVPFLAQNATTAHISVSCHGAADRGGGLGEKEFRNTNLISNFRQFQKDVHQSES